MVNNTHLIVLSYVRSQIILILAGRINYADGQSSQSSRGLSCRERINILKFCGLFSYCFAKTRKSKHFHHFQSSKIRIVSTIPQTIHADGEILGKRSIDMVYTTQNVCFVLKHTEINS